MATEIELKLRFPAEFLDQIKQLSLLKTHSITEPTCQKLYSIYYDTTDFLLKQNRISLRTRKTDSEHWVQTIKSGATAHDGLHQQNEWEYAIADNKPDFLHWPTPDIEHFFSDPKLCQSLQPIFVTDFQRTLYLLEPSENFTLEFCIDEGMIISAADTNTTQLTQPLSETICEIELELKTGETSQLLEFSKELKKQCVFPLIPENKNKAARGYALLVRSTHSNNQNGEPDT